VLEVPSYSRNIGWSVINRKRPSRLKGFNPAPNTLVVQAWLGAETRGREFSKTAPLGFRRPPTDRVAGLAALPPTGEGRTFENGPAKNLRGYQDRLCKMESEKRLSPRELETLTWAAKGKTYSETAKILDVSFATIHTYITNLKLKMNAANIAHAVARGYELGILELGTAEPRVITAMTLTGQRPDASALNRDPLIVVSENFLLPSGFNEPRRRRASRPRGRDTPEHSGSNGAGSVESESRSHMSGT
jgi:DNA-binding CsgD family transcriptional regulator